MNVDPGDRRDACRANCEVVYGVMTAGNGRRTLEASMSETARSTIAVEIAAAQEREAFLLVIHVVPTSPREGDRDD